MTDDRSSRNRPAGARGTGEAAAPPARGIGRRAFLALGAGALAAPRMARAGVSAHGFGFGPQCVSKGERCDDVELQGGGSGRLCSSAEEPNSVFFR